MSFSDDNDLSARAKQLLKLGDSEGLLRLINAMVTEKAQLATDKAQLLERCESAEESVRTKTAYISELRRLLFGRRSEKLNPEQVDQLYLAFGGTPVAGDKEPLLPLPDAPDDGAEGSTEDAPAPTKKAKQKRPNHKGRGKLSDAIERIINRVCVPLDERQCQCCGEEMACIGNVEHETIEHVPEKFVVHVEQREKLACKKCSGDITTAARQTPVAETRAGVSVLAAILDDKGEDALPINRLADRFKRLGWDVPYNTLLGYWAYAADLLLAIADATVGKILDDYVVALDDTSLTVLGNKAGDSKFRGHLWCFTNTGPMTGFRFTKSWHHTEVAPWIDAITGFIQVDDYKGYSAVCKLPDGRTGPLVTKERRLGCMMHVRRKFYEAFVLKDKRAAEPVALIKEIYAIEERAKQQLLSADQRLALRQAESVPLLKRFYEYLEGLQPSVGTSSKFAVALRYAIAQKEFVERCFTDGRFEIDNGKTEREIRRPAVGRKNYLFTGSVEGGKRLAAVYTLILSCRNLGIDTRAYLIDVLGKRRNGWPVSRLSELTPDNWARSSAPPSR